LLVLGAGLVGAGVEDRDQAGMVQAGQYEHLGAATKVAAWHAGVMSEYLDRDVALEPFIPCLIHHGHGAAAQRSLQPVAPS